MQSTSTVHDFMIIAEQLHVGGIVCVSIDNKLTVMFRADCSTYHEAKKLNLSQLPAGIVLKILFFFFFFNHQERKLKKKKLATKQQRKKKWPKNSIQLAHSLF